MRKFRDVVAHQLPLAEPSTRKYSEFDALDGRHPWQKQLPDSYLLYPARVLPQGRVIYFNFALAKEMGLIDKSHPHQLNADLEAKLVETFSIQIINEYDQTEGRQFPKSTLKQHPYMATRYLQLQHDNKQGRTSGDGRSVWNGSYRKHGKIWDVSSRGTGVTALSPGAVEAQKPIRSGDETFGYGCGMADVDELLSSALMSEVFHNLGVRTERMLAVIEISKKLAIGVRAAPNLVRPAHLFLHLKQGNYNMLKKSVDMFLRRQVENRVWKINLKSPHRYDSMLREIARSYAEFAARLEREYIFCWLDWDGDNCLADAAILDYGSIRIFGLRHDQYRYDDVQRYSTNLNEQRGKARLIVQVFAQAVEFLKTGKRKPLPRFKNNPTCHIFDEVFDREVRSLLLQQVGFDRKQVEFLINQKSVLVEKFEKYFYYFETAKTRRKTEKLPDGINKPAIFNMRQFLREVPDTLKSLDGSTLELDLYYSLMQSQSASTRDMVFRKHQRYRLKQLLKYYHLLVKSVARGSLDNQLDAMSMRAKDLCRPHRFTGNGIEHIVWEVLKFRRRNLKTSDLQEVMEAFIAEQSLPNKEFAAKYSEWAECLEMNEPLKPKYKLFKTMMSLVTNFEDDI